MTAQTDYSENMAIGFSGMLDPKSNHQAISMRNDEASAEMAFGIAVKYDDAANDPSSAALLTAITGEVVPGIVLHSHAYDANSGLGDDGILPGNRLSVLRRGRVLVTCENGCQAGNPLHVRAVAAGAELAGALRSASDGTDTIDMTGRGQWMSNASAGGLAWLEVDFTNPLT